MPLPTLILPPELTATKTTRFDTKEVQLGDGYTQVAAVGVTNGVEEWSISSDWLLKADADVIVNQLTILRGATPFAWTPNGVSRGKVYTCEKFEVEQQGSPNERSEQPQMRRIKATFVEFLQGECEPYRTDIINEDEILGYINGIKSWLTTYTRAQKPFIINTAGLMTNSFHDVLGRGAYFTFQSCTTEGQFVGIRAAVWAYEVTSDIYWLNLAVSMANAAIQYLYPIKPFPPVDWQQLDENNISVAHWLCNLEAVPSKGPTAPDPLNYGYFYLPVTFVNGVGQIPAGAPTYGDYLANVYRVIPLGEQLLWQNVYAFPRYNPDSAYDIDYWVTNVCMKGLIRRFYPDAQQPGGRQPIPTTESVGLIKLMIPYNGQLSVIFSTYTGEALQENDLYEPYPMWRKLRPGEALAAIDTFAWSYEAYKKLWQNTGNLYWYQCMFYTGLTEVRAAQIENSSCWYKKYDSTDPFRHPGSQIIIAPEADTRIYTATRNFGGDKNFWLRVDATASSADFPSIEIQNFAVQPAIDNTGTTIQVETACSLPTQLKVIMSLSQNAFDFSKYYIARISVPGANTPVLFNLSPKEFLKWNTQNNVWNPYIAEQPVYSYSGLGGELSVDRVQDTIDGIPRDVYRLQMNGKLGYTGVGFVTRGIAPTLGGAQPSFPLKIFSRAEDKTGYGFQIKITVNGIEYYADVPIANDSLPWSKRQLNAGDFTLQGEPDSKAPADGTISNIEFQAIGVQRVDIWIWYIGGEPEVFPAFAQTYKAALVSELKVAHTLWCGNFEAVGSPNTAIRYVPGVNLFTVNLENKAIDSWRGACLLVGYQDPAHLVETEQWSRLTNQLKFMEDSQNAYQQANSQKLNGLFFQGFVTTFWDAVDFVDNRGYNVFTENTIDPNAEWTQYTTRPLHSVARAWYLMAQKGLGKTEDGKRAERIAMRLLGFLFSFLRQRNSNQPPTNFTVARGAEVLYHEPATASLILRAAIYANLAGGNSLITFGIIKAMYEYMKTQYLTVGNMAGSFTAGQPEFLGADGVTYRENFGFWTMEILESLAILYKHREEIRLPSCSSPLI